MTKSENHFKLESKGARRYIFEFNSKLSEKLSKAVTVWIFCIPFFYWAFSLTSQSGNFIIKPITVQGIILVFLALLIFNFGVGMAILHKNPHKKGYDLFCPVFSDQKVNFLIFIVLIATYWLYVSVVWKNVLRDLGKENFLTVIGVPIYLFAVTSIINVIFSFGLGSMRIEKSIIIDLSEKTISIRIVDAEKNTQEVSLEFSDMCQLIFQKLKLTSDLSSHLKEVPTLNETGEGGIFLDCGDSRRLIHFEKVSTAEKMFEEMVKLTTLRGEKKTGTVFYYYSFGKQR
ncbi:MAG: hypothetical protein D6732_07015 [Methanobacteriota archaeon]|nr:MAG: hypothetical protein D6732_07015 [Euryarchaeota archaeon]